MELILYNPEDQMHGALNRKTLSQASLPFDQNREQWCVNSPWTQEYLAANRVKPVDCPLPTNKQSLRFVLLAVHEKGEKRRGERK